MIAIPISGFINRRTMTKQESGYSQGV